MITENFVKSKNKIFITKAEQIHGKFYNYSKVEYVKAIEKVIIICPKHGEFEQSPNGHLSGKGCTKCGKIKFAKNKLKNNNYFIEKASKLYNNFYDYSKVEYINAKEKVIIICPEHGEFEQTPNGHLSGRGCYKCGRIQSTKNNSSNKNKFIKESHKIHGIFYDYSKVEYINAKEKVIIICPKHGEFEQSPRGHLTGNGCPYCANEIRSNKKIDTLNDFIFKSVNIHQNNYDYSKVEYINSQEKVIIICPEHGEFEQLPASHISGHGCPSCAKSIYSISQEEKNIIIFLNSIGINNIQKSNFNILQNQELDIYLPDYNLAIEYNGLYWHSDKFKSFDYHQIKTNKCLEKNKKIIHIFENEWLYQKDKVKSRLLHIFNKTPNKINARNCNIKIIDKKIIDNFCENNYLGFYDNNDNILNLGLFFNNDLVSIISFKIIDNKYFINNFCTKLFYHINGGLFKLIKYFEKNYNNSLYISINLNWNSINIFLKNNFTIIDKTIPNFYYVNRDKLSLIEETKYKIYDSGNIILKNNSICYHHL